MGKAADQIETHIQETRENLGSNLRELEHKVKSATNWKHHFRKRPMTMLGIAFVGGLVLANILGSRR